MSARKSSRKIIRLVTPVKDALENPVHNDEFAMGESAESVVKVQLIAPPDKPVEEKAPVPVGKRVTKGRRPLLFRGKDTDGESENVVRETADEEEEEAADKETDDPMEGNEENTNKDGVKRTIRAKREGTDQERTCEVCEKLFPTYRQYRYHIKYAHKEIPCPHCDQSLYSKTTLENHIWAKHREHAKGKQRQYPCRFCEKVWSSNSSRFSHEATHKQRRFECSVCKQLFFNGYTRNQHELTHSNEAVRCSFCKRLFENASVFAAHLQRHHPDDVDTHGAGVWNVGTSRKAKLRGSKVEREVGVVVAEYDDADSHQFDDYPSVVGYVDESSEKNVTKTTEQTPNVKSKEGGTNLVVDVGDPAAMRNAVIKCLTCGVTCVDGSDMIGHLLTQHPNLIQIKLI